MKMQFLPDNAGEYIYLPPFSINQQLKIVISKRQNSSRTLIPLCSTDQHISPVKFADILASTWEQQPHQLRKKKRQKWGDTSRKYSAFIRIWQRAELHGTGTKEFCANDLISHPWFQRIANFLLSSKEAQMQEGKPGWCHFCVLKISQLHEHKSSLKRKHRGKHLWPETNTVFAQRGKRYCSKPITTQIVEEFRSSKKTISQPFRNDVAGKISSQW